MWYHMVYVDMAYITDEERHVDSQSYSQSSSLLCVCVLVSPPLYINRLCVHR